MKKQISNKQISNKQISDMVGKHTNNNATLAHLQGYSTPREATLALLRTIPLSPFIFEPANGFGAITKVLKQNNHTIFTNDIHKWHESTQTVSDFTKFKRIPKGVDVVTNPPFSLADKFVETAMKLIDNKRKLCLLLRVQFLEGRKRVEMFSKYPPKYVLIFSWRIPRMTQFGYKGNSSSSMMAFAWFVWEKGYKGPTTIKWLKKEFKLLLKPRL